MLYICASNAWNSVLEHTIYSNIWPTTCTQNTHHLLCVCIVWVGELASIAACLYVALSLLAEHPTVYSFRSLVQADIWFLNAWNMKHSETYILSTVIQKKAFSKQSLSYLRKDPLIYTWNTQYIYVQYTHAWLHWNAPEWLTYSFQGYCVRACVCIHM